MPIRVRKDPEKKRSSRPTRSSGGGRSFAGGGNIIAGLLPLLLGQFKKRPKTMLIVIGIGVVLYFLVGQGGCSALTNGDGEESVVQKVVGYFTGGKLDPKEYSKAEIFEPLADNVKNPLPEKVNLIEYAPKRLNQGQQGSCVGWASSYAARTILYCQETGENPNRVPFSPSYLYNQIALQNCQGSYLTKAMETLKEDGDLPLSQFKYTDQSCSKEPSQAQRRAAAEYRIKGYQRLSEKATDKVDLLSMKQQLAQGNPVVIGMMVGGSFMQGMKGEAEWIPNKSDASMSGFGGHAMCIIGYDDYKFGSENGLGFLIMNSWGDDWGKNGTAWVRYDDFQYFTKEAYAMYPYSRKDEDVRQFSVETSLLSNDGDRIDLEYVDGNTFRTVRPVKKGSLFKIEFTNNIECYTYAFGMETDGSSYMLFPYTEKHSPYCGITGTRIFPRDYSYETDKIGDKDYMAIVVSKQPLDYKAINAQITASNAATYEGKVNDALGNKVAKNVNFTGRKQIKFSTKTNGQQVVVAVIEMEKR